MRHHKLIMALLVGLMALSGCASGPQKPGQGSAAAGAAPQAQGAQGAQAQGAELGGGVSAYSLDDPNSPLAKRVIYFDYDSSNINDDGRKLIELHSRYLADHPEVHVVLEGNTDERGTREYNIALGERRAMSVKQIMVLYGVAQEQIQTVSYGEERPVDPGHDEAAWKLNRRVVLDYAKQ